MCTMPNTLSSLRSTISQENVETWDSELNSALEQKFDSWMEKKIVEAETDASSLAEINKYLFDVKSLEQAFITDTGVEISQSQLRLMNLCCQILVADESYVDGTGVMTSAVNPLSITDVVSYSSSDDYSIDYSRMKNPWLEKKIKKLWFSTDVPIALDRNGVQQTYVFRWTDQRAYVYKWVRVWLQSLEYTGLQTWALAASDTLQERLTGVIIQETPDWKLYPNAYSYKIHELGLNREATYLVDYSQTGKGISSAVVSWGVVTSGRDKWTESFINQDGERQLVYNNVLIKELSPLNTSPSHGESDPERSTWTSGWSTNRQWWSRPNENARLVDHVEPLESREIPYLQQPERKGVFRSKIEKVLPKPIPAANASSLLDVLGTWKQEWETFVLNAWDTKPIFVERNSSFVNDDKTTWNRVSSWTEQRQRIKDWNIISKELVVPHKLSQSVFESMNTEQRMYACANVFESMWLPKHIIAWIIGNIMVEWAKWWKHFVTRAIGDSWKALWLCQRRDKRRSRLMNFASTIWESPYSFWTQCRFIGYELNNREKGAYKHLLKATNAADATKIFLTKYERAWTPHLDRRLKHARETYTKIA